MSKEVSVGCTVVFTPKVLEDYSLDAVYPGDKGVVTSVDLDEDEVIVKFTRQDGSVCEGFYCFLGDLEVVDSLSYKIGDRVRFDESLRDGENYPFTGVGRLLYVQPSASGTLWKIELESLLGPEGESILGNDTSYSIYEIEIAGVISE